MVCCCASVCAASAINTNHGLSRLCPTNYSTSVVRPSHTAKCEKGLVAAPPDARVSTVRLQLALAPTDEITNPITHEERWI